MKNVINTAAILFASTTPLAIATKDNGPSLEQCYPSVPDYTYQGKQYFFSRMKYNSVCVDGNNRQYQWGKIEGFYPPIDEPDGGCSSACISGYGRGQARGCTSMQPDKLVGYNYSCEENACYCLYESGTWSGNSSPCFDSMDTSNQGNGSVSGTTANPGSTCYRLNNVQPAPTPAPEPPLGSSICTREPDYECYKHDGRPACCSVNPQDCPDYMTMCDNYPDGTTGWNYCANGPDFQCFPGTNGRPSCCTMPGGATMNCPVDRPPCDSDIVAASGAAAAKTIVKFLRGN